MSRRIVSSSLHTSPYKKLDCQFLPAFRAGLGVMEEGSQLLVAQLIVKEILDLMLKAFALNRLHAGSAL